MSRVLSYITTSVWAMRQAELDSMTLIAARNLDRLENIAAKAEFKAKPDALAARPGTSMKGTRYTDMREGGVAVIDLNGRIAKRMDFFTEVCDGGVSTEMLMKDFQACLDDPNVSSIVFNIDSPGGEAFGINEISQAIYAARGKKPIIAYVGGLGCSGAYWIASACDEIVCDKSSFLGSIGVVSVWIDDTQAYKMLGFDKKVITSSNAPKKRLDLNKPEDLAEFQAELDAMEKIFISTVARNRSVTTDQVKNDFNQGGVLLGADAVKVGMANRTGSLEQVIKDSARKGKKQASYGAENTGDFDMGFKDEFKAFAVKHGLMKEEEFSASNDAETATGDNSAAVNPNAAVEITAANRRAAAAEKALADFKAEQMKNAEASLQTDAGNFVAAEIAAGRMIPAEKEAMQSLYVQAAADDGANPLAEGSRLGNLKAIQSKRAPHGFTSEMLDPKNGIQVISGVETEDAKLARETEAQADDYVKTITPQGK